MKTHTLVLISGTADEIATFTEDELNDECALSCCYPGKTIRACAPDFFEALCKIRLELEREGLIPFCYGASLNVFPSNMARQMGMGKAAYKMVMNQPATQEQLVYIFDQGSGIIPASVEKQKQYFNKWFASLS